MSIKRNFNIMPIVASLILSIFSQVLMGTTRLSNEQTKAVNEKEKDVTISVKRANTVSELIGIVKDKEVDIDTRHTAARKLGELGVKEAGDILKSIAENLESSDRTQHLKQETALAYWKIQVANESNKDAQEELLIKLLFGKNHPSPHSSVVPYWAIDELANRGVNKALPEIIKSIRYRNPNKRGEEQIRLCTTKIELLNSSESRLEALAKALTMEDFTKHQMLKRWAIEELAKINTKNSRNVLIDYALELQKKYYDENGKYTIQRNNRLNIYAGLFYNSIIEFLKNSSLTDSEINETGLQPDKYFMMAP